MRPHAKLREIVVDERDMAWIDPSIGAPSSLSNLPALPPIPKKKRGLKPRRAKRTKLRVAAQGRECTIRIPLECNHNPETTVLAHYRMHTGMGQKPNDMQAAFACSRCHALVDGRETSDRYEYMQLRLMHAEGCFRTQAILRAEGAL